MNEPRLRQHLVYQYIKCNYTSLTGYLSPLYFCLWQDQVLHKYQHKFKHVLVDEFQDTNVSQYLITRKLSSVHQNICIVGDDAQSIYAFRGANIQNILNFKSDYPDLKVVKLEQNYRSTQTIVNAANSVIGNNPKIFEKVLWSDHGLGDPVKVLGMLDDEQEAEQQPFLNPRLRQFR